MNLYFGLFCIAGALCSNKLGFDFLAFVQQCLTKKLKEKTVDRFLCFICSLVWFLYTAKCKFSRKLRVYIKERSSLRVSGVTVGLTYLFDTYSSLHARTLNNMCTVAILGQTLSR